MIDNGLRGVAYREAGHAVVALALGLQLLASKFAMRIIREQPTSQGADCLPLVDRIAICVAGMNANHVFNAPSHELAAFQDLVHIYNLIFDIAEPEGDVLRDKGHERAWDLLKVHDGSVHDIAARLLAERKIDLTGYVLTTLTAP